MSHCADLPTLVLPSKAQVSVEGLGRAGGVGGGQRRGCLGKFSYLGQDSSVPNRGIKFEI